MKKVWTIYIMLLCLFGVACRSGVKEVDHKEIYILLKQADSCSQHKQEEQAIQKYFEILKLAEDVETPLFLADVYGKLGTIFLYRNLYVDAIDMFRQSALFYQDRGAWKEEIMAWRNIGRANVIRQRSDSIDFYYQRAMDLASEMKELEILKDLRREFQFVCSKNVMLNGDTRLWLHYLDILYTSDASCLLVGSKMAWQPMNDEEAEEAEAWLRKAAESKDLYIRTNAYRKLYDLSKRRDDKDKTAHYSDLYIQYADSLEKEYSLSISLHELGESYEKQRMEAENERLKNKQLKRTFYGTVLVAFLCLVLVAGVHFYYKEKRIRKQEKGRLLHQIREKERLIEDLRKHQHDNEKCEGVFPKCEGVFPKRHSALDLLFRLKMQPHYIVETDDAWLELYAVVNLLYGDIVDKLEKCPQLSAQDVRICYLVHARLSNADLATLFNVDSRSVSKSKQRIKKKMDIASELSLEDYLIK